MKKNRVSVIVICLFTLFYVQSALAQGQEWKFDKAHSNFYFDIHHIYSTIRGYFSEYSGTFQFDPTHPEQGEMKFDIKVKSIQTAVEQRDTHLLSDAFFAVGKYPSIKFYSTSIKKTGENQYDVMGLLTIKDVTKEVTIPMTFLGEKDHPMLTGSKVAGFEGRLTLDRLEYHVGDGSFYKMGAVGKDVVVTISLEMLRDK